MATGRRQKQVRLAYISDVHREQNSRAVVPPHHNQHALVLAGDIGNVPDGSLGAYLTAVRAEWREDAKVFFVPGNHDYYGLTASPGAGVECLDAADDVLRGVCARESVTMLQCEVEHVAHGVYAGGCTLWSDVGGVERAAEEIMSDYGRIEGFTASDSLAVHRMHRLWLEDVAANPDLGLGLVATHHAPIASGIRRPKHWSPETAPCFATDLSPLWGAPGFVPQAWVFGHTHVRDKVCTAGVTLASNALGYKRAFMMEIPKRWEPDTLVLEPPKTRL